MTYGPGDNVIVYDLDIEAWRRAIVIKITYDYDDHEETWEFLPICPPDNGEAVYYIQFVDPNEYDDEDVPGIFVGVAFIQDNKFIVPDTELSRALYLNET